VASHSIVVASQGGFGTWCHFIFEAQASSELGG